ncbi:MAG: tRNA(Ile)-lysidine synthase [Thermosediminibacterales bacterium]|nr:tRNA(Ile)-lysidine synthase [Thermosediminibacterales bacterium]
MLNKVVETIKKYNMISSGDRIIVGVSGGPDSICLLHVLSKLKHKFNISLYVAHLDHMFRDEESRNDALFVKEVCQKLQIPLIMETIDVPAYIKKTRLSPEVAARKVRYEFYERALTKVKGNKVALGHNQDDQAETVLMRLLRGSGTQGLAGIEPVRQGRYIRPLLYISRFEIENYLKQNKISYRIDKTNLEAVYYRNRIRLELIPYLEAEYNPNIKSVLARTAEIIREDNSYLEKVSEDVFRKNSKWENEKLVISQEMFQETPMALITRCLRVAVSEISGSSKDLEYVHVFDIINLIKNSNVGSRLCLPNGVVVEKGYNDLFFYKNGLKSKSKNISFEYSLDVPGEVFLKETNMRLTSSIKQKECMAELNNDDLMTEYIDLDKIPDRALKVRNRQPGDKFIPLGMKSNKKLKQFFIDEKIPRDIRDMIPLVVSGDDIIWVVGYRISEKYKVDEHTKHLLVLKASYTKEGGL